MALIALSRAILEAEIIVPSSADLLPTKCRAMSVILWLIYSLMVKHSPDFFPVIRIEASSPICLNDFSSSL